MLTVESITNYCMALSLMHLQVRQQDKHIGVYVVRLEPCVYYPSSQASVSVIGMYVEFKQV
jgi:hypothetical protein